MHYWTYSVSKLNSRFACCNNSLIFYVCLLYIFLSRCRFYSLCFQISTFTLKSLNLCCVNLTFENAFRESSSSKNFSNNSSKGYKLKRSGFDDGSKSSDLSGYKKLAISTSSKSVIFGKNYRTKKSNSLRATVFS